MASNFLTTTTTDSKGLHTEDDAIPPPVSVKDSWLLTGLTSDEARRRLEKFGPNAVPDTAMHPSQGTDKVLGTDSLDA
jgi:Cation transporter/ATPase, N-terminus